jgi:hypothetical protein
LLVAPLRKRTPDGKPYTRRPEVEAEIGGLLALPEGEMLDRCAVAQRQAGYVSTEAMLHMLRVRRGRSPGAAESRLHHLLSERVLRALPKAESPDGTSLSKEQIRERAYDRFMDLLLTDWRAYDERLDYFEINFNGALVKLRLTAEKQVWRRENRSTPFEISEENGDLSVEVEEAAGSYDPMSAEALDDARYRSRLDEAIDALSPLQRRIIEMLRQGIPIDSKDPDVVTISGTLGKVEKTIRNQRDRAFARLRVLLTGRGAI